MPSKPKIKITSQFIYDIESDKIASVIKVTETKLRLCKSNALRKVLVLDLAFFYSHSKNPSPDYRSAIEYVNEYIRLSNDSVDNKILYVRDLICEIQTWKEILKMEKDLEEKNIVENKKTIRELKRLRSQNAKLQQAIDEINDVDIQIERNKKIKK